MLLHVGGARDTVVARVIYVAAALARFRRTAALATVKYEAKAHRKTPTDPKTGGGLNVTSLRLADPRLQST